MVLVIFYSSIIFCAVVSAARIFTYYRLPIHLRWETHRGSSIFEQRDWWHKPGKPIRHKITAIMTELALLRGFRCNNRSLWYSLYPFHAGIYLLLAWHILLFLYPLLSETVTESFWGVIWGHTATALAFTGGIGIVIKRISDVNLRQHYSRFHYLKWLFILLSIASGFFAVEYHFGGSMSQVLDYVRGQLNFNWAAKLNPSLLPSMHVLTAAAILLYLPFSHCLRLFLRYYHELRWNSRPNIRGSRVEREIEKQMENPVGWSAEHVPDGKTWRATLK